MKKTARMNVRIIRVILAAMLVLSLAACSCAPENKNAEGWYSFTDHKGNNVVLQQKPQKVAVLFSSFGDIWMTAGGKVNITVGETVQRGFAEDTAILVDSGAGKSIDTELLIASKPDFVICSADVPAQQDAAKLLAQAGIPCASFRVESFEDYLDVLRICTDITGNKEMYQQYGADVGQNIEQIMAQTQQLSENKKILFVRAGSGSSATKAKTAKDHFAAAMLKELGTYNIAENATILLDGLSLEEIIVEKPEYIFISTMGDETAAKEYINSLFAQPQWQAVETVKNGNYIFLPKELFQYKPNSRWDKAYEYLVNTLYE